MEVLVTKRLTLRSPLEVDADDIALHLANWNVSRMLARAPFPYDRKDAEEWIARCQAAGKGNLFFTIHRERLIGAVGVEGGPMAPRLGYWLGEAWWGKGYMKEAVGAVLGHVFELWPDAEVTSTVFADNPASLKLQQHLGFRVTGGGEQYSAARAAMAPSLHTKLIATGFTGSTGVVYDVAA